MPTILKKIYDEWLNEIFLAYIQRFFSLHFDGSVCLVDISDCFHKKREKNMTKIENLCFVYIQTSISFKVPRPIAFNLWVFPFNMKVVVRWKMHKASRNGLKTRSCDGPLSLNISLQIYGLVNSIVDMINDAENNRIVEYQRKTASMMGPFVAWCNYHFLKRTNVDENNSYS